MCIFYILYFCPTSKNYGNVQASKLVLGVENSLGLKKEENKNENIFTRVPTSTMDGYLR